MTSPIPPPANAVMQDKGKPKNVYLKIENSGEKGYVLYIYDTPNSIFARTSFLIRRSISELKSSDNTKCTVSFVTTSQEIIFTFKTPAEASAYLKFIVEKSDVHGENNAIAQIDIEMRQIWPFPASYF